MPSNYCEVILALISPSLLHRAPVKCGGALRLQHLSTKLFLHSHHFSSPLSGNQEVSAFGDGSDGDRGQCVPGLVLGSKV